MAEQIISRHDGKILKSEQCTVSELNNHLRALVVDMNAILHTQILIQCAEFYQILNQLTSSLAIFGPMLDKTIKFYSQDDIFYRIIKITAFIDEVLERAYDIDQPIPKEIHQSPAYLAKRMEKINQRRIEMEKKLAKLENIVESTQNEPIKDEFIKDEPSEEKYKRMLKDIEERINMSSHDFASWWHHDSPYNQTDRIYGSYLQTLWNRLRKVAKGLPETAPYFDQEFYKELNKYMDDFKDIEIFDDAVKAKNILKVPAAIDKWISSITYIFIDDDGQSGDRIYKFVERNAVMVNRAGDIDPEKYAKRDYLKIKLCYIDETNYMGISYDTHDIYILKDIETPELAQDWLKREIKKLVDSDDSNIEAKLEEIQKQCPFNEDLQKEYMNSKISPDKWCFYRDRITSLTNMVKKMLIEKDKTIIDQRLAKYDGKRIVRKDKDSFDIWKVQSKIYRIITKCGTYTHLSKVFTDDGYLKDEWICIDDLIE